ncbi:hypothetical protein DPMN_165775 [Dreissena polymorpha]|uniref:Uncharacterized protein n=1 Tax=Dreissena polymorpha TaxID=45954 RepID=A0A9D4EY86_DREPO|nr:hypothetical protein DPMN_165775 [Dreissena polymorpha]
MCCRQLRVSPRLVHEPFAWQLGILERCLRDLIQVTMTFFPYMNKNNNYDDDIVINNNKTELLSIVSESALKYRGPAFEPRLGQYSLGHLMKSTV